MQGQNQISSPIWGKQIFYYCIAWAKNFFQKRLISIKSGQNAIQWPVNVSVMWNNFITYTITEYLKTWRGMERTWNKDCGSSWSCRSWRAGAPPQLVISEGGSMTPPPGSFMGLMSLHRRMKSELTTWTYMLAADGTTMLFFCKQNHAWSSIRYQHLYFINHCTYHVCIYNAYNIVSVIGQVDEVSFSNII